MPLKLLFATSQAGTIECFSVLAEYFKKNQEFEVMFFWGEVAKDMPASKSCHPNKVFDFNISRSELHAEYKNFSPDIIFCGLTDIEKNIDYQILEFSRKDKVPSIAILDSWMGYKERVTELPMIDGQRVYPTKTILIDESSAVDFKKLGVPAESISVCGHPKFDKVIEWKQTLTAEKLKNLRSKYGVPENAFLMTFFSQPISRLPVNDFPGYNELEVIKILFESFESINDFNNTFLILKDHPRGLTAKDLAPKSYRNNFIYEFDSNPDELVGISDVILGMSSTIMVYAGLYGKPVISIQPNVKKDYNPLNKFIESKRVENGSDLIKCLKMVLNNDFKEESQFDKLLDGKVCERIAKETLSLARKNEKAKK